MQFWEDVEIIIKAVLTGDYGNLEYGNVISDILFFFFETETWISLKLKRKHNRAQQEAEHATKKRKKTGQANT